MHVSSNRAVPVSEETTDLADALTASVDGRSEEPRSRASRRRTRRVEEMLRVTAEVLTKVGYHALSLEKVADELDLSPAALYHYFPSKDALVAAAIRYVGDRGLTRLTAVSEQGRTATERLRLLIADQLRILSYDYPEARCLFLESSSWAPPETAALIKVMRQRHNDLFRDIIDEAVRSGEMSPRSIDVSLHCLHGALNYSSIWYLDRTDRDEKIAEITDTVMLLFNP
jgi:AcrR family transcriptional regulator